MALKKTSLQLDARIVEAAKKIALEQDVSYQKWVRGVIAAAVTRNKRAKSAARRRAAKAREVASA